MKKILIFILVVVLIFNLSSCLLTSLLFNRTYAPKGQEDLYTVAVCNIFGATGYYSNGEISYSPVIIEIEKDGFGRVMFYYSEFYSKNIYCTAYVIMQKSENGKVDYYQYDCQMTYFGDLPMYASGPDDVKNLFSDEEIEEFKSKNDWNKELDLSKCTESKIITRKKTDKSGNLRDSLKWRIYFIASQNGYNGKDTAPDGREEFCCSDKNGLELYCISASFTDKDGKKSVTERRFFALILFKSGSYAGAIDLTDQNDYYDAIKQLMAECGWVNPDSFDY